MMEVVVSAVLSREDWVIKAAKEDKDLHQILANKLGISRDKAKIVNLASNYGMTPFGLAKELNISEEEAKTIQEEYWNHRPNTKSFRSRVISRARELGYVYTIYGFRRKVSDSISDDQIWNTLIQGSAADLVKRAMIECYDYLEENNAGRIMLNLHDQLVFSLNSDAHIAPLRDIMENIDKRFPLKVDVSIGSF